MEEEIVKNNEKTTKGKLLGGITGKGFMPGQSGNLNGRPKDTLKDYMRQKLKGMTEEEKEKFIKDIPKELQWRMAEGNPEQEQKHSGDLTIQIEQSLADKYNVESSARDNSDRQA